MSRAANRVVILAAALLPARVRDRYREQWLGELRDAPELGLRPSEIALGSLAFAATFARSMPGRPRATEETISRRARLSIALSTSAAALAISQYAGAPIEAQTGPDSYGFAVGAVWAILTLYVVVAPIAAILAVLVTRGMSRGVRVAVVLISALCVVPLTSNVLTDLITADPYGRAYLTLGTLALPALGAAVVLIVTRVRRRARLQAIKPVERIGTRMRRSAVAGVIVAVVTTAGFVAASALWAARKPLVFGNPVIATSPVEYEQWMTLKAAAEQAASLTLSLWIAMGLSIACAIVLTGLAGGLTLRSTAMLTVGTLGVVLLSFGSLIAFLQLMLPSATAGFPIDLATELGQITLVVLVLFLAGRSRSRDEAQPPVALERVSSTGA